MNINEANMDLKDTLEAQNSPKNQLKELVLYQLVAPNGEYIGEPISDYRQAWVQLESPSTPYSYITTEQCVLSRVKEGYKVIEIIYSPKG